MCPECKRYMTRARVMVERPFYVERCPNCNGIWCDRGEWEILEALGLHESIEQLFSGDWQAQMRSLHHNQKERQATIDKLGPEVAQMVFDLAEVLENHPNGEFGVAYLMRRFDKPQEAAGDRATNPPPSLF
nr:zf-TFIIB domain-containing protein [Oxynema sp. CENA135]